MSKLVLENIWKQYGQRDVLRGIDIAVEPHESVVLIGASGSGKSTLLKCIDLLERVDDGRILLDGVDITDPRMNADAVRSRIGIVFQAFNLFPHRTVLSNVTLALRAVHGMPKAEATDRGRSVLDRLGLGAFADSYPDRLSGGQQQRVAIARAVAAGQSLLLLDEVTSALDPELVGEVLSLVKELRDEGTTIVMATHEMAFAREVADRVVFLDDGVVCESGPPEQVLRDPVEQRTREYLARFLD